MCRMANCRTCSNCELPDMLELRRIVVAVFNNREIPDEKIRNPSSSLLTLKHPFLEVATSDRLWELMTDWTRRVSGSG